ncbi:ABC transporter [Caldimicrobium thiodismutans]|uniref:ABC transporter n=1 Tax=Caldimicrobium thiodismutans TaxID=1653476 RepID=A0A0U4N0X9_9BACT|nr:ABC transporter permease [Caldimicrobium thiodismutans]BAU22886.1 ABC transporter [Caldimicrobium thiodismutans]
MRYVLFIVLAFIKKRRKQTLVSILGVAISVTAFIVMSSIMFGFQKYFVQQVIDIEAHLTIKPKEETSEERLIRRVDEKSLVKVYGNKPKEKDRILGWREIMKMVEKYPEVLGTAPHLESKGILKYGAKEKPVSLIGILPQLESKTTVIERFTEFKRLKAFEVDKNTLIIGRVIARDLGINELNKKVVLTLPNGETKIFKVVDFLNSGITNIDSTRVYIPLQTLQALLDRTDEVNAILIKIKDVNKAEALARKLQREIKYEVESWQKAYLNFLKIFKIQSMITYMIVFAIITVSAFGIFNIIMMTVMEKRKEIAILMAMGYNPRDIISIFLSSGLIINIIGGILGFIMAYGILEFLANLELNIEGLLRSKGFILDRSWKYYFTGFFLSFIFSLLASFYPAYRASRLNPVEIFRSL